MKLNIYIIFLLFVSVACSSDHTAQPAKAKSTTPTKQVVTEDIYEPIEEPLDIIEEEVKTTQKDQIQIIVDKHIESFPSYHYENPEEFERLLAESYRLAKDALDRYYLANLDVIESQVASDRTLEERLSLESYISQRYITVQKILSKKFITTFFRYKYLYTHDLLGVEAFNPSLLSQCSMPVSGGFIEYGFQDMDDKVDEELDALDSLSKGQLNEYWGGTTYVDSSGMNTITISEAIVIADKLEDLRETLYEYRHCEDNILTAQQLYLYLLNKDKSVFKTKYLTRDASKAKKQGDLITDYVESVLTLVFSEDYSHDYHGKLARQYSVSFKGQMLLHGPWAEKEVIEEGLKSKIYISMSEKFLESSAKGDEEFYSGIRCNMYHFNHFALQYDNSPQNPAQLIPFNNSPCH